MDKPTKTPARKPRAAAPAPIEPEPETFTFKRSHVYSFAIVLAFAAGLLIGYLAWGRNATPPQTAADPQAQSPSQVADAALPTSTPRVIRYDIPADGFPSNGPEDAPIVLVEFSDYQCPFCTKWHNEVYEQLLAAYPGQIRFVYRNLPLTSIHPEAFPAAEAALCAGEQGRYFEFHDALFDALYGLGAEAYVQYATDLGLNMDAFRECLESGRQAQAVQADMDFAINLGINSTPTFFINGLAIIGAQPLQVFTQVIDKELAGEIP